jgi:hypothetical protein
MYKEIISAHYLKVVLNERNFTYMCETNLQQTGKAQNAVVLETV